jgi:hypothetical protein
MEAIPMKINFNVTGKERKALVETISRELNITAKYLGTPRYDYQIGVHIVSRDGVLTGEDNRELVASLQGTHGYAAITEEYDQAPLTGADEAPASEELRITEREELDPGQEHRDPVSEDGPQDSDIHEPETGIFQVETNNSDSDGGPQTNEHDPDGYDGETAPTITTTKDGGLDTLTIEYPLAKFTPDKLDNLFKMVNAKTPLLKAALGTDDLPIQQVDNALRFPWFRGDLDADKVNAYTVFIHQLCKTALEKKRVTAKEKEVPGNPKYAMRCWLLALGFIGSGELKAARKILLSRLEGNSSWRDGKKAEAELSPATTEVCGM